MNLSSKNPEISFKSVGLGLLLAILLSASTAYLGLKLGRTIAGSIPAAVLSILVLRLFGRAGILEHNIVQTAASAGEAVTAAVIFTIPALVIMGYWSHFSYFESASIILIGGFLGVCFSIPLRRIMIVEQKLPYPEGIATARVLKVGDQEGGGKLLLKGGFLSMIVGFFQEGYQIFAGEFQAWKIFGKVPFGFGFEFSPVLIGAGYIVGLRIALPILFGSIITWIIGIPVYAYLYGFPEGDVLGGVMSINKHYFKYIAIGAMFVGGLLGIFNILGSVKDAIKTSFKKSSAHHIGPVSDTDRDIPMNYIMILTAILSIPLFILFYGALPFEGMTHTITVIICVILSILLGFLCAAISGYITGIVGTTCLPVSGLTITAILFASAIILILSGGQDAFALNTEFALKASAASIMFGAIICLASSLSGDNMQDLKAGHMVGATPWKQQFMLLVGVVAVAIVLVPILNLLYTAYGIGDSLPRPGMNPELALAAPQATMMATVAKGMFSGDMKWNLIGCGVGIGVVIAILDQIAKKKKSFITFPVLSIALGMYLPISLILPLVVGGLVSYMVQRAKGGTVKEEADQSHSDILFSSGMIAGNALVGILIAIPISQGFDFKSISPSLPAHVPEILASLIFVYLLSAVYRIGVKSKQ